MNRQMLSFDHLGRRFQMRAVAIIRRDAHLLIHKATHEEFWSLPGGRVEFGETAAEAVEREIADELNCSSRLGFVIWSRISSSTMARTATKSAGTMRRNSRALSPSLLMASATGSRRKPTISSFAGCVPTPRRSKSSGSFHRCSRRNSSI